MHDNASAHDGAATAGRIPQAVARQAVEWYVRLRGEGDNAQLHHDLRQWRAQDAQHERAWRQIEQVNQTLPQVNAAVAMAALAPSSGRRRMLQLAAGGATFGLTALLMQRWQPWQAWQADLRTATGQWRNATLPDGSQLTLNTATAVQLVFDAGQRRVRLLSGEVLIRTSPDAAGRPFLVETDDGVTTALGTVFSVRQMPSATRVAVYAHAVRIAPAAQPATQRLEAGWQADFSRDGMATPVQADERDTAWSDGVLDVLDMPLGQFVQRLARYRPGYLACDPDVAGLRLSGVFPLTDTDAVLHAVQQALPVRIETRTRYWTRVLPA